MDEYVGIVNRNTEFFTSADPEDLFQEIAGYFEVKDFPFTIAKGKYKIKATVNREEENES